MWAFAVLDKFTQTISVQISWQRLHLGLKDNMYVLICLFATSDVYKTRTRLHMYSLSESTEGLSGCMWDKKTSRDRAFRRSFV